jgi:hypothetical protein
MIHLCVTIEPNWGDSIVIFCAFETEAEAQRFVDENPLYRRLSFPLGHEMHLDV